MTSAHQALGELTTKAKQAYGADLASLLSTLGADLGGYRSKVAGMDQTTTSISTWKDPSHPQAAG